ncbi:fructose-bisphosphatase class II, partial [Enterobacter intestinihominis]
MDFYRDTQSAALARYNWVGRGDKKNPQRPALQAIRNFLNKVKIYCK